MNLLKSDYNLDTMQLIDLLILVMVTSSFCGFIYELLFYRIDLGYFVKRGSSYGPWVPRSTHSEAWRTRSWYTGLRTNRFLSSCCV